MFGLSLGGIILVDTLSKRSGLYPLAVASVCRMDAASNGGFFTVADYLFDTRGRWIAFSIGRFVYSAQGSRVVGWFAFGDDDVITLRGKYLGTVVANRLVHFRSHPNRGNPGDPGDPGEPRTTLATPGTRGRAVLSLGPVTSSPATTEKESCHGSEQANRGAGKRRRVGS